MKINTQRNILRNIVGLALAGFFGLLFFMAILPSPSDGAGSSIVVNEIAWMGSLPESGETVSQAANDEWIELYNHGESAIDLSGWMLKAADGNPTIALQGNLSGGDYLLLSRANETVQGIAADIVYPYKNNALSNGGERLQLFDAQGILVDEINAASSWPAGENDTKQTMERTGLTPEWATSLVAGGTPKTQNSVWQNTDASQPASTPPPEPEEEPTQSPAAEDETVQQSSPPPPPELEIINNPPQAVLEVSAEASQVGEIVTFDASGSDDPDGDPLTFLWFLGDGRVAEGETVTHRYTSAGIFTVELLVNDGQNQDGAEITVSVAYPEYAQTIRISEFLPNPEGKDAEGEFIELFNEGQDPVALGGWTLDDMAQGSTPWKIPSGVTVAAGDFIVFFRTDTGIALNNSGDEVRLFFPNKEIASQQRYADAQEGWSFARFGGQWAWTKQPTPGRDNVLKEAEQSSQYEYEAEEGSQSVQADVQKKSALKEVGKNEFTFTPDDGRKALQEEAGGEENGGNETAPPTKPFAVQKTEATVSGTSSFLASPVFLALGIILIGLGLGTALVFFRRKFSS